MSNQKPREEPKYSDVHLTLCLTHDCNLRCGYCYGGSKDSRAMSMETAEKAVKLALARVSSRLHLMFFGGEPFLCWNSLVKMTEMAERLANAGHVSLFPTVTTNGTLMTDDRASWLHSMNFTVGISCDGSEKSHNLHRVDASGRGTHTTVVEGLRAALTHDLRVRVVLVLDPANIESLPDSIAFLSNLGLRNFVVNCNWSADWSDPALQNKHRQVCFQVAEQYLEAYRAGKPFWISLLDTKISTHIKGGYGESDRCDLGRKDLVVAASGNLYPCDRLVGEDRFNHYVVGHVESGVDNEKVASLREKVGVFPAECLMCKIASRCRNRCACANVAMTGGLDSPSGALCIHEQHTIAAADWVAAQLYEERNSLFLRHYYGRLMPEPVASKTRP